MNKARQLLEKSDSYLDAVVTPQHDEISADFNLTNSPGYVQPTERTMMTSDGWIAPKWSAMGESRARSILSLVEDQQLPHSNPDFHLHSLEKAPDPKQSAAKKYANKLRSTQRDMAMRRAIGGSGTTKAIAPKPTPSMKQNA